MAVGVVLYLMLILNGLNSSGVLLRNTLSWSPIDSSPKGLSSIRNWRFLPVASSITSNILRFLTSRWTSVRFGIRLERVRVLVPETIWAVKSKERDRW